MKQHRVTCVVKPNRLSQHEHITYIGTADESTAWPREQVIKLIEAGTDSFYVSVGGNISTVGVVSPAGYPKYIRTYADGKWNDNLLALPECVLS